MRNPNPKFHGLLQPWRFLVEFSLLLLFSSSIDAAVIDSEPNHNLEWQILTKTNFSSQIHLHHHILLIVTVPWSGESRSLMMKVADAASHKLEKFDDLRLMVLYKNKEKMLADALGVAEETTIFFYHHAISYKYQGRLRTQNIMSSAEYIVSSQPEELPLTLLDNTEDLNAFFKSTDKAVLLFEFCGWTPRLLTQRKNNGIEKDFHTSDSGIISGANFYGKTSLNLNSSRDNIQKGLNNGKLTCDTVSGLGGIPWVDGFTTTNHSSSSKQENASPGVGLSCNFDESQRFESFFSKFMAYSREFFLPPERLRFGLISERYLLSSLGVRDLDPWLVMIHFAGCSNCSKILKEGDDLRNAFSTHHLLVTELESEGHDIESALPRNRPSIILFVDRSSELSNTRRNSKAALETFRELALHNQHPYRMASQDDVTRRKPSDHTFHGMKGGSSSDPSKHSSKDSLQLTRMDSLKSKMSIMIVNEDGNIALDSEAHGRSIQDILTHLLRTRNEAKLSVVAKEVGFQLLSDDIEVKLAEFLQPQVDTSNSDKVLSEDSTGNGIASGLNLGKYTALNDARSTPEEPEERTDVTDFEPSQFKEGKITYILNSIHMTSSVPDQVDAHSPAVAAQDLVDGRTFTEDKSEIQEPHNRDVIEFYFCDGGYHLLNSLASTSEVPSILIIDPTSEQHFLYPQEEAFNYSSLQQFLDLFLNESLIPYQRSESVITSPKKSIRPPFINLDFREVDSIPRVTAHSFSELVLGFDQSENKNIGDSWKKDVLVLFSNNWCGFCQRMELVVREVFRAFNGYLQLLKIGSSKKDPTFNTDIMEDARLTELPVIYLMDCILNECNTLLKSMGQKEVYPKLLLFPAQRKTAISYKGDISVNNVIKFLVDHSSNFHHLVREEGFLWTSSQRGNIDEVSVEDASPDLIQSKEDYVAKEKYHEVVLNNRTPTRSIKLHVSNDFSEGNHNVAVGSVLLSTDKLLNAPPFDKSMILIVQSNRSIGFQGLIINKRISWKSLEVLNSDLELVKQSPLSLGGPLIANEMPLVSLTRRFIHEGYPEVLPSVFFLDQFATIREIQGIKSGNQSTDDYWFFLGYSGWGWEQLFSEIAEGAWQTSDDPLSEFIWPES